jgi:predicted nucleotide-binding protein
MAKQDKPNPAAAPAPKKGYLKQEDIPSISIQTALRVPQALRDNFAKQPTKPLHVAKAMGVSAGSGPFRMICGASIAYGLTEGGAFADLISLTDLGRRVVAPLKEGDDSKAIKEAFLKPRVIREFLTKFNNNALPKDDIGKNILEELGVPRNVVDRAWTAIVEGSKSLGLLVENKGKWYVDIDITAKVNGLQTPAITPVDEDNGLGEDDANVAEGVVNFESKAPPPNPPKPERGNAIFLGHGANKAPLEQLKKMLTALKIPYKVATEEPNQGLPIPTKVARIMAEECSSAILTFTKDIKFFDAEQQEVWRPSENVMHELGASGVLYGGRIIIFKEKGLTLPSNFSSIGYIEFETGHLESKTMDLLQELVVFGLVKISAAGSD